MKTIVYATKSSTLADFKVKIINVISGITANQLANVFCELQIVLPLALLMMEEMWKLK